MGETRLGRLVRVEFWAEECEQLCDAARARLLGQFAQCVEAVGIGGVLAFDQRA